MKIDMFAELSMLWLLKENLRDEICWLLMADAVDGEQKSMLEVGLRRCGLLVCALN